MSQVTAQTASTSPRHRFFPLCPFSPLKYLLAGLLIGWVSSCQGQPLALRTSVSPNPARPGERFTVEVLVSNQGDTNLNDVRVQFQTPANVFFQGVVVSDGGTCSGFCDIGELINWSIGTLPPGHSRTVNVSVPVASGGSAPPNGTVIDLNAMASHSGDPTAAQATSSLVVNDAPVLRVSVEEDSDPVEPGGLLNYTLTFGNPNTLIAPNAQLRFTIPEGTSFISADGGGALSGGVVEWSLGNLNGGEVGRRTVTVMVDAEDGGSFVGEAELFDSSIPQNLAKGSAVTGVRTDTPLLFAMIANPDPARPGERVTYELTVSNQGDVGLMGVGLRFQTPERVFYQGMVVSDGGTCSGFCENGENLRWSLGALQAGQSRTVNVSVPIHSGAASPSDGTLIENRAWAFHDGAPATSAQSRTLIVDDSPLLKVLVDEDRDPVSTGETLTYILTYGNQTTLNASNATLRFKVPLGTSFVSADQGGSLVGGTVEWSLGTINAGEVGRREVRVMVIAADAESIRGEAEIEDESNPQNLSRSSTLTSVLTDSPLVLKMIANPDPAQPGERVTYELTVSNRGEADLTGVGIRFQTPEKVFYQGLVASEGGTCSGFCENGELLSWSVGSLQAGHTRTVNISVPIHSGAASPNDGTLIENRGWAFHDGLSATPSQSRTLIVDNSPLVKVYVDEDRDPVSTGGTFTYILTYGNQTTFNASNTTLRFKVPEGTTFVSADQGGTLVGDTVEWFLGILSAGEVGRREVQAIVTALDGESVVGDAEIADESDPRNLARSSTITSVRTAAPLLIKMIANPDPAAPGERVTYEVTASNRGDVDLTGVELRFQTPEGMFYQSLVASDGGVCNGFCENGEAVRWSLGSLVAGQSRTVSVSVRVHSGAASPSDGTLIENRVWAFHDGMPATSAQSRTLVADNSPLVKVYLDEDQDPVSTGEILTYTLTYGNPTALNASNATLRFEIPEGTSFVSADQGGNLVGDTVEWFLGTLNAGEVGRREVQAMVTAVEGESIVGEAELSDDSEPRNLSRSCAVTSVRTDAALVLRMTANPDPAQPGERVNYELAASNRGDIDLTGVEVRFQTPESMFYQGLVAGSGGVCNGFCENGENLRWSLGPLRSGHGRTVSVSVPVHSGASSPPNGTLIENRAWAFHDGGEAVAAQSRTLVVDHNPVLTVLVDEDQDPVEPGDTLNYTLTYGNVTDVTSPNTTLRFNIPAGTAFVSATGNGTLDGDAVEWRYGALQPHKIGTRQITVMVTAGGGEILAAEAVITDGDDPQNISRGNAVTNVWSDNPLRLVEIASPDPAKPGETLTFELTAMNQGNVDLTGVALRFQTPEDVFYQALTASDGGLCNGFCENGELIRWDLGNLLNGQSRTVTVTVPVRSGASSPPNGTLIRGLAHVVTGDNRYSALASATIKVGTFTPDIPFAANFDFCPPPNGDGRIDACDLLLLLNQIREVKGGEDQILEVSRDWMRKIRR